MTALNRIRVPWVGGVPGGGLSTFYTAGVSPDVSALKTWFTALAPYLPPSVTVTIPSNGDTLESTTGVLTGGWSGSGGGTVTGTGNSAWSDGVGLAVQWNTGLVVNGRRLRGRTFVCPLAQGFASSNGTLNDTIVAAVDTASNTLAAAALLYIWHRPTPSAPTSGSIATVTSVTVPDRVTALRSRRY